ncbi:MAG: hypothetical protein JST00_23085 [Deltaproteobacteria bacterium]|nr:hypothetical protein [Deltaproteobacteria bacterium]
MPPPKESPYEVVVMVVSLLVLMAGSSAVVRFDERRLDEEQLERAWPPSSRDNALIGLSFLGAPLIGLFAVWFHFFRTRRWRPKGFFLGLLWVVAIMAVNAIVVIGLSLALGLPLDE